MKKIDLTTLVTLSQELKDFKEEIIPKLNKIDEHLTKINGGIVDNSKAIVKIGEKQTIHSYVLKSLIGFICAVMVGIIIYVVSA